MEYYHHSARNAQRVHELLKATPVDQLPLGNFGLGYKNAIGFRAKKVLQKLSEKYSSLWECFVVNYVTIGAKILEMENVNYKTHNLVLSAFDDFVEQKIQEMEANRVKEAWLSPAPSINWEYEYQQLADLYENTGKLHDEMRVKYQDCVIELNVSKAKCEELAESVQFWTTRYQRLAQSAEMQIKHLKSKLHSDDANDEQ